jgi:aldose sugar dehydrogenase
MCQEVRARFRTVAAAAGIANSPGAGLRMPRLFACVRLVRWLGAVVALSCAGASEVYCEPPLAVPPRAVTLNASLDRPWGLAFLPDGRMLVSQNGGSMVILSADGKTVQAKVSGVPAPAHAGLLDVALDPDFDVDPWVYWTFADSDTGIPADPSGTAVARGRLVGTSLQDVSVIYRQVPKVTGVQQYGSRIAFRRDKTLWVTLGDRQVSNSAQDLTTTLGKVIRINRDGTVPSDNPAIPGARPEIWSYGHRNPQGAAIHPGTGELWISEHGPQGGDELNRVVPGGNFGWPLVSYGCNYGDPVGDACRIGGGTHAPTYVEPVSYWVPISIAPAGTIFYTGTGFPQWQGQVFLGALAGTALWRVTLEGNAEVSRERMFFELGERIRDVAQGPDGWIYLITDSGKLIQIGTYSYPISTFVLPSAGGAVGCSPNPVIHGGTSVCTATPNAGYAFGEWSGDCTGAACTLGNVTSARSVTANFISLAAYHRAYLASHGSDANPCTLRQPCRLLPAALAAVADGGEIWMLDSANYNTGTVGIGKSVSILAVPGAVGSVAAIGGPAVSVSAANLNVALRNLAIVGLPGAAGTHGVSLTGASTVTIENSLVANLPGYGLHVAGVGAMRIVNSTVRNNQDYGIRLEDGAHADISGTQLLENAGGVYALAATASTTAVLVSNSTIAGDPAGDNGGITAYASAIGAAVRVGVTRSGIEGQNCALASATAGAGSAVISMSGATITNNASAWCQSGTGAVIQTLGNNIITDNGASIGSLSAVPLQ